MLRLKEIRQEQGLTLADLERISGIHYSVLNRYENGKRKMTLEKALILAAALDVTVEHLAGVNGEGAS